MKFISKIRKINKITKFFLSFIVFSSSLGGGFILVSRHNPDLTRKLKNSFNSLVNDYIVELNKEEVSEEEIEKLKSEILSILNDNDLEKTFEEEININEEEKEETNDDNDDEREENRVELERKKEDFKKEAEEQLAKLEEIKFKNESSKIA